MNNIRKAIVGAVFGGSVAAGFERQPDDIGLRVVGSGQTFEEPAAVAVALPSKVEIPLNREQRRALGFPKGQLAALVAENSLELSALEDALNYFNTATQNRRLSMGQRRFNS